MIRRNIRDVVETLDMKSSPADIICFINTWAKAQSMTGGKRKPSNRKLLWDFLTGLRGPDYCTTDAKRQTTIHIRAPIMELCQGFGLVANDYFPISLQSIDKFYDTDHPHFIRHAKKAMEAVEIMFSVS